MILFGVIPGPSEPSLSINSYLCPLVEELQKLWHGVEMKLPGAATTTQVKCALLGVACDLPAARKSCGFLSFPANLGCSRCYQQFSRGFGNRRNYANFEREHWELRTNSRHRSDVNKILKCSTKTEREKFESQLGCRYTVLLDLPYFRPIEMLLIDPMHNLFLGTAKHFARDLWIGCDFLSPSALLKIEARLKNTIVPSGLGRLPVSINTGVFLTAEQWKNWTIYFSVFCLGDLLPRSHIECWRKFVLACRRLVKFSISQTDITVADGLLLRFCKRSTELYGESAITPNMHMHCHLSSCLREFGPIHSFWLFPFERYNGILEEQPTNNRSIEIQLMRRFQRDNLHLHLQEEAKQWPNASLFLDALPNPSYDISLPATFDESVLPGTKSVIDSNSSELFQTCLSNLYRKLYPSHERLFRDREVFIPSTFRKYSTIKWHGKSLTSVLNKNAKNCFVFLPPPFPFTGVMPAFGDEERLAEIQYFFLHTISLPHECEPKPHLFACLKWPMIHPKRDHFGKPVEVWCNSVFEAEPVNRFCLASTISSRAIISSEVLHGECVRIAVPLVE